MKTIILILLFASLTKVSDAQNYANIVNYGFNGTPTKGLKIKTKIPFANGTSMPTIKIEGYEYGKSMSISLLINLYIYNNRFYNLSVSSSGGSVPDVWLSNENGFVSIFLNEKVYYQRFTISAYAYRLKEEPTHYKGWTIVDEALGGTMQTKVAYRNNFGGNVGIGTEAPQAKLDVRGKILANEVEIKVISGADFVFDEDYSLMPLAEVENFIKENKHLPEIPSEKEMQQNGLNVNDFQIKLLQKIEELTLHMIHQQQEIDHIKLENKELKKTIKNILE